MAQQIQHAPQQTQQKKPKLLGERLIEGGYITQSQLSLALSEQRRNGGLLGEILEKLGFVTQDIISKILANDMQTEFVDVLHAATDPEVLKLIPLEFAKEHMLLPLDRRNDTLTVAMTNTFDVVAVDAIEKMTGLHVEVVAASGQAIHEAIEQKYIHTNTLERLIEQILSSEVAELGEESGSATPVIQLVDQILSLAIRKRATDIHLEPEETLVRIRFRIDGTLYPEILLPKALQQVVTARIKIMAGFDVTEHRLPQDGRIAFQLGKKPIDLRVSSLPIQYGESIVLRILDKGSVVLNLDSLGMGRRDKELMVKSIAMPHGIILVTGPTGSGKTTTLYAALGQMDALHNSIFTLEDPVEYRLPMIRQTQINSDIGMNFADGLRALLRQDPDVILVGEIRDEETAQLATRAALTGHLVLSTLHTNSAAGTVPRLINMGIEPYLISSTLVAIISQRLVRRVCPECKEYSANAMLLVQKLGIVFEDKDEFRIGKGCAKCNNTGYSGRIALYEILHIDALSGISIQHGITEKDVLAAAQARGMRTMLEDGIEKARKGICSLEDIVRVVS